MKTEEIYTLEKLEILLKYTRCKDSRAELTTIRIESESQKSIAFTLRALK
jgi:hypothetical protein